jgi:hypothetical protein
MMVMQMTAAGRLNNMQSATNLAERFVTQLWETKYWIIVTCSDSS